MFFKFLKKVTFYLLLFSYSAINAQTFNNGFSNSPPSLTTPNCDVAEVLPDQACYSYMGWSISNACVLSLSSQSQHFIVPGSICVVPGFESYVSPCYSGNITDNDSDNDGLCNNQDNISGCTNSNACNYNNSSTVNSNNSLCRYATGCDYCGGNGYNGNGYVVDGDTDNDGLCNNLDNVSGCTNPNACNYNNSSTVNTNNSLCVYASGCDYCSENGYNGSGYVVDGDTDNDGLCNNLDNIFGCTNPNACNYNNSSTVNTNNNLCIYSTDLDGCATCSGEQDGSGVIVDNDQDNDGVCDADEIVGCQDQVACNYMLIATDPGNCIYSTDLDGCATCSGEQDGSGVIVDNDQDNDGVCDADEIIGCQDSNACNYMSIATDPGSCVYSTDLDACATCSGEQDGSGLIVDNDQDNDGVCDADEIEGCTDETACNYDSTPTTDTNNVLCIYSTDLDGCATCSGEQDGSGVIVDNDQDNDGVCDADEIVGCQDETACNYKFITTDSGNCIYSTDLDGCATCSGEQDGSGVIVDNDQDNDGVCDADEIIGCQDETACNYMLIATDPGNCIYSTDLDGCATCSGEQDGSGVIVDNDQDNDGVCDADEIEGCTDETACNYDSTPTTDTNNVLCIYSTDLDGCATCSGEQDGSGVIVDNDQDNDGVCDADEIVGCQDQVACNYMLIATDPGNCIYSTDLDGCATCSGEQDGSGVIVDNDQDNDGVCDADEIIGCQDSNACNYMSIATDPGSCVYSTDLDACATCSGEQDGSGLIVDNDQDNDGVCDADEIEGCTDETACNYDSTPTTDTNNVLCIYSTDLDGCATCSGEQDGSGVIVDNDQDNDGVCDADEIVGCQDQVACNYMLIATDPGNCIYSTDLDGCATCSGEQDGSGVIVDNDQDNDGVCDADEIAGCQDQTAFNFMPTATDPGFCYEIVKGCMDPNAFNYNDLDGDNFSDELTGQLGVDVNTDDGSCYPVVLGCMNSNAFNFNDYDNNNFPNDITGILGTDVNTDNGSCSTIQDFQYSMAITGIIQNYNGTYSTNPDDQIAVFDTDGVCVGIAKPSFFIPSHNAYAVFMMVYSNQLNESYSVEVLFSDSGEIETYLDIEFSSNSYFGTVSDPFIFRHSSFLIIEGCTNETSFNFNEIANFDDGSCIDVVQGCLDDSALNFNSNANVDDGSCIVSVEGCMNANYVNFNPEANVSNNSCSLTWQEAYQAINLANDSLSNLLNLSMINLSSVENLLIVTQDSLSSTELDLAQANTTISGLNSDLASANSSISNLEISLSLTQSDLSETQTELSNTETVLTATQSDLSDTQSELVSTQDALSSTELDLTSANTTISGLNTDLASANSTISGLNADLASANSSISNLEANLSVTQSDLADTQTELSNTESVLTATQSDLSDTQSELVSTQDALSSTELDLTSANTTISGLKSDLASANSSISNLEANLSVTQSDLADTQTELSNTESVLATTQSDLSETQSELVSTQDALSSTELDLASANTTISGLNADLDAANLSIVNLETSLSITQLDLSETQSDLSNTESVLATTQSDLSETQSELVSTQDALSSTELDLASANTTISGLNADLDAANLSIVNLETSLSITQLDLSETQTELSNTESVLATTQSDLSETQSELVSTQDALSSTELDLASANTTISGLNADLDAANLSIVNLETSLSITQLDLSETQSDLSNTESVLATTQSDLSETQSELVSTQDALSSTELDLASANTTISGLNADLDAANLSIVNLETSLSITQLDLSETQTELSNTESVLATTQSDLSETQSELVSTQDALSSTELDLASANTTISGLNADLATANSSIENLEGQVIVLQNNQEDGISQSDVDAAYADGAASVEIPECEEVSTQNIPLDLPEGWSMFGYTCIESVSVVNAFSDISTNIDIVKDELGLAYLPSWNFSAFDNLEYGEGYQIKMIQEVTNFQFCPKIIVE